MTGVRERRRLLAARTCFACRQPIPTAAGVYWAAFDILVHQGFCHARVLRASRDFSRSSRGRHVPRGEVLRRLQTGRAGTVRKHPGRHESGPPQGSPGSYIKLFTYARAYGSYL